MHEENILKIIGENYFSIDRKNDKKICISNVIYQLLMKSYKDNS
jgi:hypothetical protein